MNLYCYSVLLSKTTTFQELEPSRKSVKSPCPGQAKSGRKNYALMVSSTTFLSPSPPSVAARLSETVYGRHELSIILDAPFDMHATLSHDTPAASACALLYAVLPWFEASSRFNQERRWLPSRLNCPDTVSLGIGNEKGAMITHHTFMLHDDCSVFTKLALKNR